MSSAELGTMGRVGMSHPQGRGGTSPQACARGSTEGSGSLPHSRSARLRTWDGLEAAGSLQA